MHHDRPRVGNIAFLATVVTVAVMSFGGKSLKPGVAGMSKVKGRLEALLEQATEI